MTTLGRERMFEYFSRAQGTRTALLRLNYATELRYGVLVDLALEVLHDRPIDVTMSHVNVIWLADANTLTLAALAHVASPARIINLAGAEILRVRDVCKRFGQLLGRQPRFTGQESDVALLNNGGHGHALLGQPSVSAEQMIRWTAAWVARGGENLGKPTHFQVRSGKY
jgi:nucleoside-diphosphate-sugar epimerase